MSCELFKNLHLFQGLDIKISNNFSPVSISLLFNLSKPLMKSSLLLSGSE